MITAAEIKQKEFDLIPISGREADFLGQPERGFSIMVAGAPGHGKSTFVLQLLDKFKAFGNVLFVPAEEGADSQTTKEKIERLGISDDFNFTEWESYEKLEVEIDVHNIDFVAIDSLTYVDKKMEGFDRFRRFCKEHGVGCIFIVHFTKNGRYKGSSDLEHMVDVYIEVEDFTARTINKNRFNQTPRQLQVEKTIASRQNPKTHRRSKAKFDTARKAWSDIAEKTGLKPEDVRSNHTAKQWRFVEKERKNPVTFMETEDGKINFGEITPDIANDIKRQAGKIRLTEEDFIHVKSHEKQIKSAGFKSLIAFVSRVASDFDAIYKGRGASLIVVKHEKPRSMAFIRLHPTDLGEFYLVKSGFPVRLDYFKNKKLLWERAQSSRRKNATPSAFSGHNSISKDTNFSDSRQNPTAHWRSKAKFDTARAAWTDVAKKTGLRPEDVRSDHTDKQWRFVEKERKNPKKVSERIQHLRSNPDSIFYGLECIENPDEALRENKAVTPDEIYQMITDRILSTLENAGALPWHKSWAESSLGRGFSARNFVSKKPYRGINSMMLNYKWEEGRLVSRTFDNPYFLTFKQVDRLGGKIKKGSRGNRVMWFSPLYEYKQQNPDLEFATFVRGKMESFLRNNSNAVVGNERIINVANNDIRVVQNPNNIDDLIEDVLSEFFPLLKYYNVFHADDIEGIEWGELPKNKNADRPEFQRIEIAESIWEHYKNRPKLEHSQQRAFYRPSDDLINMPEKISFDNEQAFYSTFFHEIIHSTGHKKRLDRDLRGRFGQLQYAFEELIAELGATFLSAESGILFHTISNSEAYLQGWGRRLMKKMKNDNRFFFRASSKAQAAADFILQRDQDGVPLYIKDLNLPDISDDQQKNDQDDENLNFIVGDNTTIDFKADGSESVEGEYMIIEAKDLQPSHNKDCSVNSNHEISGAQPRDRTAKELCNQSKVIADKLNPTSITEGNLAFNGAPVTWRAGQVIQGNGRSIALKIAYDEVEKSAKKYKRFLLNNAGKFGFEKKQIEQFAEPVLVRAVDVPKKEAVKLGNIVDTSQAKLNRLDEAKAFVRSLSREKKQIIGRLINTSSGETIGQIIDEVGLEVLSQLSELDRTGLINNDGLTGDGKEFIKSLFVALVFDTEETDNAVKFFNKLKHTQKAGIERSFGHIIPFVNTSADITPDLQKAVEIVSQIQNNESINTVEDFMQQGDAFTGLNKDRFTPIQADMARAA